MLALFFCNYLLFLVICYFFQQNGWVYIDDVILIFICIVFFFCSFDYFFHFTIIVNIEHKIRNYNSSIFYFDEYHISYSWYNLIMPSS